MPSPSASSISPKPIRLLLLEDQPLVQQSLLVAIAAKLPLEVVASFRSVAEALAVPAALARAEIGLVDLRLGEELATESLPRLREQVPLLRLIWVTGIGEPFLLEQALRLNLPGFVHKEDSIDVLVAAIERVHGGGTFLSPTVARMRDEMRRDPVHFAKILSEREQQVLALIGKGLSNEETAALLGLSAGTIHSHRRNIMERLGLRTAAEVQSYALQYGFTSPGRLVSARSHAAGDPGR